MDDTKVTPEELVAEQAALKLPSEDEIRTQLIEEYSFDDEADKDRLDKLVAKEMDQRKKLSKAIEQKIKHRTAAQEALKNAGGKKGVTVGADDKKNELSQLDMITISRADIHEDDIPEVVEYAKFKGISIADALKSPILKTTLSIKKEERTSAEATHTGSARRGTSKVSDEQLVENASAGKLPESDEDIARLTRKRLGLKN